MSHKYSATGEDWVTPPVLRRLQAKAKSLGLYLFLPVDSAKIAGVEAGGLTNR